MPGHVTYMDNYLNQQNLDYEQVLDIIWELKGIWDARHAKKGLAFAERKTLTFLRKWWTLLAPRKDDAAYKLKDSLTCFVAVDPEDMMYLPRNRAALSVGGRIGDKPDFRKRVLAGIACAKNETDGIELKRFESKHDFSVF